MKMSREEKFPLNFWDRDGIAPIAVLGGLLNEVRQANQIITGFSELLLKSDLSNEQRSHIEIILEKSKYLESILDAGYEYGRKVVDNES
jgi:hypothetical protein